MKFFVSLALLLSTAALAGTEGMISMPKIEPKNSYTIKSAADGADLDQSKGFGEQEGVVRMMNLMMVEGSGFEGMDMKQANLAKNNSPHSREGEFEIKLKGNSDVAKVGSNSVVFSVNGKEKKPAKGLKITAKVFMTSMDMGTEEPKVNESHPGTYEVKAVFAMQGPWAVKIVLPNGQTQEFPFEVKK